MTDGIVALGGGHGLYATLSAARRLTPYVTAVVTVADDGGSSGRLRSELDVVPRAICEWPWRRWHPIARTDACGQLFCSTDSAAVVCWPDIRSAI